MNGDFVDIIFVQWQLVGLDHGQSAKSLVMIGQSPESGWDRDHKKPVAKQKCQGVGMYYRRRYNFRSFAVYHFKS